MTTKIVESAPKDPDGSPYLAILRNPETGVWGRVAKTGRWEANAKVEGKLTRVKAGKEETPAKAKTALKDFLEDGKE